MEEAAAAAEALAPGVLDAHPRVRFRLRAQAFMELVRRPFGGEDARLAPADSALPASWHTSSHACAHAWRLARLFFAQNRPAAFLGG